MSIVPFDRKDLYKYSEEVKFLTFDELWNLLNKTKKEDFRDFLYFFTLYSTGARPSEICYNLKPNDINFKERQYKLITLKKKSKKTKKPPTRIVTVTEQLLYHTSLYINEKKIEPDQPLFKFGRKNADRIIKLHAKDSIVPETHRHCYVLRHSHAIHSLNCGIPITILSRRMGHSSIIITAKYLKYDLRTEKIIMQENFPKLDFDE